MKPPGKKTANLVTAPNLPPPESLAPLSALDLLDHDQYGDFCLREGIVIAGEVRGFSINVALFSKCRLSGLEAVKSKLADVKVEQCDMSNQSWSQSKFTRVEICGSKLTGFKFLEGSLSDVKFDQCKSSVFQFFGTQLKNVMFSNCSLVGADFSSCKLENVVFRNCDLRDAIFYDAKLSTVDLRRSTLLGLKAHATDLRGAIIDREQLIEMAEQFASLLGLQVI